MGLYDRDYMKLKKGTAVVEPPVAKQITSTKKAPWWAQLKFRFWLLFHRRDK